MRCMTCVSMRWSVCHYTTPELSMSSFKFISISISIAFKFLLINYEGKKQHIHWLYQQTRIHQRHEMTPNEPLQFMSRSTFPSFLALMMSSTVFTSPFRALLSNKSSNCSRSPMALCLVLHYLRSTKDLDLQ